MKKINDYKPYKDVDDGDHKTRYEGDEVILLNYRGDSDNLVIPKKYTRIGNVAFDSSFVGRDFVGSVTLPKTITRLGYCSFANCGLKSINIPYSVEVIAPEAFSFSDLEEVVVMM